MAKERERHDQSYPPDRMILDEPKQFAAALAVECLFEVAEHVLQHMRLPARCGDDSEGRHELGRTGTHSTKGPSVSTRNGSR